MAPSRNFRPILAALLAGSAMGLAAPVLAQETAAQDEDTALGTIYLDPAHSRAQDPDGNAADRASSQYVAEAELDRARMGDLKDLFAGIASVSVGGAIPVAQKIYVNGVDMLNLAVQVDGVAQNNRIFHHVSANAFDPGLMKFVRVDAGAAPADAGPHALAGAVVMETVDAADIIGEGRNFGGNSRLSYTGNGQTAAGSATLAGRHNGFEWLLYGKRASGQDYKTGAGDRIVGSAADLTSALLKLAYETPDGHRFELSGQRMDDDALRPYRANFASDSDVTTAQPLRRYDTQRQTVSLSYENTQAEGIWDPRVVLGWSEMDIAVDQPDIGRIQGLVTSRGLNKTFSAKIENRFHLSDVNTITAGVDFYDKESTYRDARWGPYTESARNLGLYVQARLEPTERLSTSFGLRWDDQRFTGISGWKGSFSGLSGNASVSYAITDAFSLRGGASSVFGGLILEDNFVYDDAWNYGNLRASRATNYTLGFDYEAGDLSLNGELFVTKINDARDRQIVNDMESRGFNIGLGYGWDGGYLRASYSHSKITVNGAGTDSWSAVDLGIPLGGVLALEAQHTPEGSDFTFGGSIEAAKSYRHTDAWADQRIPGYAVLNLFTEYQAPQIEGLVIRAEVNNLFDKTYADRATYGQDFRSITPLYEPGRSVQIVASMKF
ncbi:TonB-dependent receptor [Xinfangfangia sp. D13-10-4-6]|uniref:TonB-dependent receptor plug domain-containing protein n=1 Tax=Pseudogemmobacter hezensis TaxID=2737662 RepID=UPI001557733A|nr:TonB-dependent receptor [Pseudogemmobacter hezensis]NPD14758.1 TonB-dependent receptor [Pseudogemmobacter hezensis]